jgi:5-methylcytosine-specific restriction endonuclease McrA
MQHKITNVDPENMVGDCTLCGRLVALRPSGNLKADGTPYWRCKHAFKSSQKATERPWVFHKGELCEWCAFIPEHSVQLCVDHIDGDKKNNDPANLQTLCHNCHSLKTHQNNDYIKKTPFSV